MSKIGFHRTDYFEKADISPPERVTSRRCLKCQAPFDSAWPGERVCRKCKATRIWRDGFATNMAPRSK